MSDLRITFLEVKTEGQLRGIADGLRSDLKHKGHRNFKVEVMDEGRSEVKATYGVHGTAGVMITTRDNYQS